ncbi:MAG: DUF4926 domain-containing protein [candidate division KSB1 bacterium]|nr:DUF4926 domain-containing protein [candidate division KSB1 bacterium]MDZ7366010.1 DUF4926 domain-containing protein [candidate division KSB1 bacterium]MDZ7404127.1 DUF4926 domain-containing protein [candidate division KSB1 bacterium]
MEFKLHSDVVLVQDVIEDGLFSGDVGVGDECHDVAGLATGYSVEFFDMPGNTVAVVTLPRNLLRQPTHADRPAVRLQLATA